MPTREAELVALIEEITRAFDGVSRENGVSLNEAWIIDDYGSDEERALARASDSDTRWQDVPDEDIEYGYLCLSFLDGIGLRYYLPAYMIWTLQNYEGDDSDTPESTLRCLVVDSQPKYQELSKLNRRLGRHELMAYEQYRERTLARFAIFTPEQSRAIGHFLQFLVEYEQDWIARKALKGYWDKFV